ncbi:MAG: hypothetical protein LBT27_00025 [Prevotellaceae bacterium]|jgi:TonB-dependent SusC/RagA subfamily outer membrane receptor|nr:hypothetical protein [Prevotellaceae bacterium]
MGTLLVYIIKSGICLSAFYLFYKLLLSNETFHKFNRAALLGILFLSMILPMLDISLEKPAEMQEDIMLWLQYLAVMPSVQAETVKITWLHIALLVYVAGVIFFLTRNIFSTIKLYLLIKSGKKQRLENHITLVLLNNNIAPFSWMRYIVISENDFNANGNEIIAHERAHILKRHSIDLLLCQIYNIVQWLNPVVWLFIRELQNIHEYQADEDVIKKGIDTKHYKMLLIQKAVGAKLFAMANNFKNNKLKKRIKMMSKQKSNPYSKLKYLYVLPLLAVVVTTFANPDVKNEMKKISAVNISDFIDFGENISDTADNANINNITYEFNIDDENSEIPTTLTKTIIEKLTKTIIDGNDTINIDIHIEDIDKSDDTDIHIDGFSVDELSKGSPLFVLDGQIIENIDGVNSDNIQQIDVLKDKKAVDLFGDKGKNGVIIITTKKDGDKKSKSNLKDKNASSSNDKSVRTYTMTATRSQTPDENAHLSRNYTIVGKSGNKKSYTMSTSTVNGKTITKIVGFDGDTIDFNNKHNVLVYSKKLNLDSLQYVMNRTNRDSLKLNFDRMKFTLDTMQVRWNSINWDSIKTVFNDKKLNLDSLQIRLNNINRDSIKMIIKGKNINLDSLQMLFNNVNLDSVKTRLTYRYGKTYPIIIDGKNFFNTNPLIIVDDKEMSFDEYSKTESQIGKVTVLKNEEAIKKFGTKGRNGVIIIETSKYKNKK